MEPLSKLPPSHGDKHIIRHTSEDPCIVNPVTLSLQLSSLRICGSPIPPTVPPRRRTSNFQNLRPSEGSQNSRPNSPPPATTFPPFRRPSLSLPPSPRSVRTQRSSLPTLLSNRPIASGLRAPSPIRAASTPASPAFSRPPTPPSPPTIRRSPRRRSNRTPSPRPPLPRPNSADAPPAARQKVQYSTNTRMRSR